MTYYDQVNDAAALLRVRLGGMSPKIGIVLGSGLGAVADAVGKPAFVPTPQFPTFPIHRRGHSGPHHGGIAGRSASGGDAGPGAFLRGLYAATSHLSHARSGALGVKGRHSDQCAGGIAEGYSVGQLVVLADHINLMAGPAGRPQ